MSQTANHTSNPNGSAQSNHDAKGANRRTFRFPNGYRCRLSVLDTSTHLCFQHAKLRLDQRDLADLSADLFGAQPAEFQTAEQINKLLAKVVLLLAQGRISPRRAAVITFACSLLLRSVVVIDSQVSQADDYSQVIADLRSSRESSDRLPPSHPVLTEVTK